MCTNDLERIHQASMQVLEETGIKLMHPEILDLVKKNGIRVEGETVFFTEEQIMTLIKKAPSSFTIYARNPEYDMTIGGDKSEYAPGFGAPMVADFDGNKRPALFSDYKAFLKLVHETPYFNVNGGVLVQPKDLDLDKNVLTLLSSTILHSDKSLMGMAWGKKEVEQTIDILGVVFGGKENLKAKPRIIGLINTNSPLQLTGEALDTLMGYVKYGQPVILTPGPMAGTTGPITLAGHMVMSNAEALAGIAVAQMLNPGTPVVYGVQGSVADLRTGNTMAGAPESALIVSYCAKMARYYGLPCRSGGVKNDARSVDVQAGYESMMMLSMSRQSKINYIIHSVGILESFLAMSYEKFIIDIDIIGIVDRLSKGIEVNDETLAVDVIKEVGPAGQFMSSMHTAMRCRTEHWLPDIGIKHTLQGQTATEVLQERIAAKKQKMLDSYTQPELSEDIYNELKSFLEERGVNIEELVN